MNAKKLTQGDMLKKAFDLFDIVIYHLLTPVGRRRPHNQKGAAASAGGHIRDEGLLMGRLHHRVRQEQERCRK